jgi:hypothetical protein
MIIVTDGKDGECKKVAVLVIWPVKLESKSDCVVDVCALISNIAVVVVGSGAAAALGVHEKHAFE